MKKTTLALIFLHKLFSLHIYFVQTKRSICDIDFIKHLKKTCETFTGRGQHSIQEPQPFAGRTICGRGPQFAHPCFNVISDSNEVFFLTTYLRFLMMLERVNSVMILQYS